MAATLTQERFTGPEWIFERKFDGIRVLAFKQGSDVRLLSRNRLPQNLPAVGEALARLPVESVILDGEVTWAHRIEYHVFASSASAACGVARSPTALGTRLE